MTSCLFCRMISGEIKPSIEYEDEFVLAIHDINPQAPHHVLVIPKKHIEKIGDLNTEDISVIGSVVCSAKKIAAKNQWADFRLVFNNGADAGQSVFHIHLHLLSGRKFSWPPG